MRIQWAFQKEKTENTASHFHIFVGNLSGDVADPVLLQAFQHIGECSDARVMWDHSTGRSKGFGFVSFRYDCSALYLCLRLLLLDDAKFPIPISHSFVGLPTFICFAFCDTGDSIPSALQISSLVCFTLLPHHFKNAKLKMPRFLHCCLSYSILLHCSSNYECGLSTGPSLLYIQAAFRSALYFGIQ